ncbi:hypothetical protein [Microbacterium sp. HJ5]
MSQLIRTRPLAIGGMLLAAVLLSACAGPGPAAGGAPPGDGSGGTSAATPGAGAPDAFTNRDPLPSCGSVELDQGETIPQDAIDCLSQAGAGGAELVVTMPTVEGDPITTYYRALPGGGIETFSDMTQDSFGGGWGHEVCEAATTIDEFGACGTDSGE